MNSNSGRALLRMRGKPCLYRTASGVETPIVAVVELHVHREPIAGTRFRQPVQRASVTAFVSPDSVPVPVSGSSDAKSDMLFVTHLDVEFRVQAHRPHEFGLWKLDLVERGSSVQTGDEF